MFGVSALCQGLDFLIVVSSFVLSEIQNLQLIVKETNRILRDGGIYAIAVTHPSYDLRHYIHEKITGVPSQKIKPARDYFDRRKSEFVLGAETHEQIMAPHYHRTVEDYVNALRSAGFLIDSVFEPAINEMLLKEAPRFAADKEYPISLIIKAVKSERIHKT